MMLVTLSGQYMGERVVHNQEAEMTGAVMSGWKAACAAVF
jgi:hypothetical protein